MLRSCLSEGDVAMATHELVDPYIDPESGVLQNLRGAQSWEELAGAEAFFVATGLGESAPSFRAEVNRRGSGGAGLVLDVLFQHGDGCPADRSSEVGAGPEPLRTPVVLLQFGELPAHVPAGHPFEAVDEM